MNEKEEKQRTLLQNKCLHKYSTQLAEQLNDAGYDQKAIIMQFKEGFHIPWTMHAIKHLFREIGRAMYGIKPKCIMNDPIKILTDLYDSEINFQISTFWDGGYTAKIGDKLNGFRESSECLGSIDEVASELARMAITHFPNSVFAKKYADQYLKQYDDTYILDQSVPSKAYAMASNKEKQRLQEYWDGRLSECEKIS